MSGPHDPTFQRASTPPRQPGERAAPIPARPDHTVAPPPLRGPSLNPPRPVTVSFWLWVASFVVGLLAIAYSLSRFDELHQRLADTVRAQEPGIGGELLNRAVDITLYIGLGGPTAVILLQLLLAVLMRARRNWARVLLAVLAVVGIAGAVFSLVTVAEQARVAVLVQALLIVVATVLMSLPAASTWFRQRAA